MIENVDSKLPNRVCMNEECKKEYYCCYSCEKINSWKRVVCSPECFQKYIGQVFPEKD
jgi:hypothetical protein